MYGGGYIFDEPDKKLSAQEQLHDDPEKLTRFEEKIQAGEKIEPGDWMPSEYRRQLIRLIEQHAHSEVIGALPEGTWITRAPGFKRKMALIAKVQDEIGHGQLLYNAAETLGKSRESMINDLLTGKSKYSNVFNYPAETWADVTVIGFLIDAAAIINQLANARGSYGPYCRALERICYEESFHLKQGQEAFASLAAGTHSQQAMLQDALNRWWPPIMQFFGPPDKISAHSGKLMQWKVKMASNDDMRNQFLDTYVPKVWELAMTLPDPLLKKNESSGRWDYTEPDWDQFFRVIQGEGPCNKERLDVRRWVESHGRWVRLALMKAGQRKSMPMA
ncbi:MAG TPA: 1,2-phenylacetyl-CoA epoxidase subunit PaaA [Chitinophagaceae bacterium]|nr:1,2-phenylacetyl-CoA epoxidase subunit PaaA [Chitinophagaceae bacterium]